MCDCLGVDAVNPCPPCATPGTCYPGNLYPHYLEPERFCQCDEIGRCFEFECEPPLVYLECINSCAWDFTECPQIKAPYSWVITFIQNFISCNSAKNLKKNLQHIKISVLIIAIPCMYVQCRPDRRRTKTKIFVWIDHRRLGHFHVRWIYLMLTDNYREQDGDT